MAGIVKRVDYFVVILLNHVKIIYDVLCMLEWNAISKQQCLVYHDTY